MKVVIAAVSSSGQLSGVQRHAINLAQSLLTRGEVMEVHFLAAEWQREGFEDALPRNDFRLVVHYLNLRNKTANRNLWYCFQLPQLANQIHADIVHLAYPMPVLRNAFRCPVVVTLHDCYPYDIQENFGIPKVFFNRIVLRQCLRAANAIACVSRSTLDRLSVIAPDLARDKASVIYNMVNPSPENANQVSPPWWRSSPFVLCVAQHRRNKNIPLVLRIFERLLQAKQLSAQTRMVIIGIEGPETQQIMHFIEESGLADRVILLNGITEEHLQWSYAHCMLLLAPSSIEGFGLPVAEGLLAGCRIVCSDIPAFREIGDSHCSFVRLGKDELRDFTDAVCKSIAAPAPLPIALPQLSADKIADKYMKLYSSLSSRGNENAFNQIYPPIEKGQEIK
jgi:glycosyltransferase involved in cell wall biosynthesis